MATIIDLSNKRPRAFVRVSLGAGPRASGAAPITILLLGNKTSSAPSNPLADSTMEQVFDEDVVIARTGGGSELHRMFRQVTAINPQAAIYIGAIPSSAGAAASLSLDITGTATEDATIELTIGPDTPVSVGVRNGDTAADVRAAIIAALNAVPHSPVTAAENATAVVLTAKCTGPRGNGIRVRSRFTEGSGAGLVIATLAPSGASLTGGATTDDPTALLANTTGVRFHLTAAPYGTTAEAVPLGVCVDHVNAQAEPLIGKRGRLIVGNAESLGTAQTFAFTTLNEELVQIAWQQEANETPAELAAALAGRLSVGLGQTRAFNFDGTELDGLTPQWDLGSRATETEVTSALNNGLTALFVSGNDVKVSRSITSKSRSEAGGSTFDYSVLDSHYVDVAFFVADLLEEGWPVAFPNQRLGVVVEGEMPPPGVATSETARSWALGTVIAPLDNDLIENFATVTIPGSRFTRNEVAKGRVDAVIPIDPIELFHQFAADVRQL